MKTINHSFTSGNSVEVTINETEKDFFDATCKWEVFPPSEDDLREYQEQVVVQFVELMREK